MVPYVDQPPEITPSVPTLYATTMTVGGYGVGMVVETHEGRPTKAEGNPRHPASLGALGTFGQASILSLYDPSRGRMLTHAGEPATWRSFVDAIAGRAPPGKHAHLLLEPSSSPHLIDLVRRVRRRGDVAVHFDEPLVRSNAWQGAKRAFGRAVEPQWDFSRAEVLLALDADFLASATSPMAFARSWAERRRLAGPSAAMSRLYVIEARLSVTGMAADERLPVQPRQVQTIAADLLAAVVALNPSRVPAEIRRLAAARPPGKYADWVTVVARDLRASGAASVVVPGDAQPAEVHLAAHAMNQALGAFGRTVTFLPPPLFEAGERSEGLDELLRALDSGEVASLVIVGGDPVYTAPADLDFARRLRAGTTTAYVGLHENATARACQWFVPQAHFLESWGDARAFDGSASIAQPLMRPMFDGKTASQVLAAFVGRAEATSRDLVQSYWRANAPGPFDVFWQRALVHGVIEESAPAPVEVSVDWTSIATVLAAPPAAAAPLEILYFADAKVHDGRFAENAWLQELPDPVTKLTWDNAALVGPSTASRLDLHDEDVAELQVRGRVVRAPVAVVPGMADGVVAIALGYGQRIPDRVSYGVGADAYGLRDSSAPGFDEVILRKVSGTWPLAFAQEHGSMHGRPIALACTLGDYRRNPDFAKEYNKVPRSLYALEPKAPHQWGMTVDLNACTGCSACVVACMAENNVPVVGKVGVRLGRAMHWLRIDRYYSGQARGAALVVQPMLCQHCEKAPCEYVCPVNATVHSDDGLNEMVYNRCVGTRFCSNNCPYKVRRFNYFSYDAGKDPVTRLAMNPDVTVRSRGVMEKCTYCVQRIRETEIRARREQRPIRDAEILTACQQTCPTGAIVFGDIADPSTHISETRRNPRVFQVLSDLGTLPRTRYMARVTNPSPELGRA
jgi:molybdopterin-containing oxidoreductase family iron-sulfur binding subunit